MWTNPQTWLLAAVIVLCLYLDGKQFLIDVVSLIVTWLLFAWIGFAAITVIPLALLGTVIVGPFARLFWRKDTSGWPKRVIDFISKYVFFGATKNVTE